MTVDASFPIPAILDQHIPAATHAHKSRVSTKDNKHLIQIDPVVEVIFLVWKQLTDSLVVSGYLQQLSTQSQKTSRVSTLSSSSLTCCSRFATSVLMLPSNSVFLFSPRCVAMARWVVHVCLPSSNSDERHLQTISWRWQPEYDSPLLMRTPDLLLLRIWVLPGRFASLLLRHACVSGELSSVRS